MSRFRSTYRKLTPEEVDHLAVIKERADGLEVLIGRVPDARYRALAMTALEESVMWSVKGITG